MERGAIIKASEEQNLPEGQILRRASGPEGGNRMERQQLEEDERAQHFNPLKIVLLGQIWKSCRMTTLCGIVQSGCRAHTKDM